MEKRIPTQFVLYENDAVLVSYTNGAGLQLSPCGSSFFYYHPLKEGEHPLHGQKKIQQRTEFVTSTFKDSVAETLDFRNRFAEQPFLCQSVIDSRSLARLHADICEIAWPEKLHKSNIQILPTGSVALSSMCELGKLTLSPSRQHFSVEFFCRVSQTRGKQKWEPPHKLNKDASKVERQASTEPGQRAETLLKYRVKTSVRQENTTVSGVQDGMESTTLPSQWDYAWVSQSFSVDCYPEQWQHPLYLTLEATQPRKSVTFDENHDSKDSVHTTDNCDKDLVKLAFENLEMTEDLDCISQISSIKSTEDGNPSLVTSLKQFGEKGLTNCVFSPVPKALSLNCVASHFHKWGTKEFWDTEGKLAEAALLNGRIKVVCSKGVIYRFLWSQPKAIEIYPGDGSLLRSSGLSGHFFTHFIYSNGKVEERMYSITMPPPDIPGTHYSIARLINTGERYLRHLYEESLGGSTELKNCCWKRDPAADTVQEPMPNVLLEECLVPGIGKFTAFSSGRVRIVFTDRTALDMYADFSQRLGRCKEHSDHTLKTMPDIHTYKPRSQQARLHSSELPQGLCKLMLPSGHFQQVLLSQPDKYDKYIQAAKEWAAWVNSSPNERYEFYKDTIHDPEKAGQIDQELRKINCFNYIVEKTLLPQFESKSSQREQYMPTAAQMEQARQLDPSFNIPTVQKTGSNWKTPAVSGPDYKDSDKSKGSSYFPTCESLTNRNHSGVGRTETQSMEEANYNLAMVEDILRKTSHAVNDLDRFLKVNGEEQPVRE